MLAELRSLFSRRRCGDGASKPQTISRCEKCGAGGGAKHFEAKKELKHGKAKNDYWRSKTRNP